VLARNLANAETPNYKAIDFDFQQALAAATGADRSISGAALRLATTRSGHTGGTPLAADSPVDASLALTEREVRMPSLDGNTVDVQMEQAAFAQNAVRYQASLNFVNSQLRGLMTAITGQ
jgi:flagellar basal-body rod protein FlgB